MRSALLWVVVLCGCASAAMAADPDSPPKSLDKRLKVELFAEDPQVVTPTGIDVDALGRVWVIESNTHFPPADYKGHKSDRLLIMSEREPNGKAGKITRFTDGLKHAMSVAVRPAGDVYVATRREIILFKRTNSDDQPDNKQTIVTLETAGDYPHNGLAGFAFDALGWMYFGCGENLGADYKIIGSDGKSLSGGGEGGNVYRCRPDGSQLTQWATGFWNPHASCIDAFGRLFTVDNDPDSRPPCRLLHVVRDGDYGYRFRNGRKGLHPFTSWNGELPGTLPMVAGTGEAPSGILAYESDGLPPEYVGNLFATSWGDHRIDRFQLKNKGGSFTSLAEPLIIGGENFRPVGIACAPDGSLYFSDWVLRDYKVHGKGRVWRISMVKEPSRAVLNAALISSKQPVQELAGLMDSPRVDVRRSASHALAATPEGRKQLLTVVKWFAVFATPKASPRKRIEALWGLANVPLAVEDFGFMRNAGAKIAGTRDEVEIAVLELFGSPQFPFDRKPDDALRKARNVVFEVPSPAPLDPEKRMALTLAEIPHLSLMDAFALVAPYQPFVFAAVVNRIAESGGTWTNAAVWSLVFSLKEDESPEEWFRSVPERSLAALLATRRTAPRDTLAIQESLASPLPQIRRAGVQWVAEEHRKEFKPQVEAVLNDGAISSDLFLATLAALEMLDGKSPVDFDKTPAGKYVLPLMRDDKRPAAVRAQALRLVAPDDPALDAATLKQLLAQPDAALRLEAIRSLQMSQRPQAAELLRPLAASEKFDAALRNDAVLGLANAVNAPQPDKSSRELLEAFVAQDNPTFMGDSLRSLRALAQRDTELHSRLLAESRRLPEHAHDLGDRTAAVADQFAFALGDKAGPLPSELTRLQSKRPADNEAWEKALASGGDPAAGRRVFYHANSAGCFKCHTINGRGGKIGPDLSTIGRTANRVRLIGAILDPSREVAPQFVNWALEMESGKVHSGMIVEENSGTIMLGGADGTLTELKTVQVVDRIPQKASVMPEKLADRLTPQEFLDLVAFLESLK